jgi:hypothetical protein
MKWFLVTKSIRVLNCGGDTAKFHRIVRGICVVLRKKERIVGPGVCWPLRHYDVWGTEVYFHAVLNCAGYNEIVSAFTWLIYSQRKNLQCT